MAAVVAVLLAACAVASADGKFFSAEDDVAVPNQKALLWLDDGRETLILQVKYEGAAGDFGWVVPVPGRPRIDTASSELFYELAWVTKPVIVKAPGPHGMQEGGREGVTVVERAQVGPYDATVLAATDSAAVAGWLREHGYRMPVRAEEVLGSYVARGWYYVAARIDTARLQSDLLKKLRRAELDIGTLDEAPQRLAEVLVGLAERKGTGGREVASAVAEAVDEASGRGGEGGGAHGRSLHGEMMLSVYDRAVRAEDPFEEGPMQVSDVHRCLETCAQARGVSAVKAAAREAGIGGDGSVAELAQELAAIANRDLRRGVPYAESEWRCWPKFVAHFPPGKPIDWLGYERDYEMARGLAEHYWKLPPPPPEELTARSGEGLGIATDSMIGGAAVTLLESLKERSELYHRTREAVVEAVGAVEKALSSGSIEPLLLEFESRQLVYPLYITSLSPGQTEIQLYVLSDHRVQASGYRTPYEHQFRTAFAGRLDEKRLKRAPVLTSFVSQGREYLTELRGELDAGEMTRDVSFARAATDDELREKVTDDGRVIVEVPAQHFLRSFAWFVGIGLAALIVGIMVGRALRPRQG